MQTLPGAQEATPAEPLLPPNNLPARREFVGRKDDLSALHEALKERNASIVQPAALYGLAGVGKTALALEYAYLHAADYPGGIWWLLAEENPTDAMLRLSIDLRMLAPHPVRKVVDAVPVEGRAEDLARAARLGLQQGEQPALLLLDNVDQSEWREWLPGGLVRILMTTRDKQHAVGRAQPLEALSQKDARDLADQLAGAPPRSAEEAAARDRVVVTELGGLPVAVELAARAVNEWRLTWSEYEQKLKTQTSALLEDRELFRDYPRGALAAIDLSLDRCPVGDIARRLLEGAAVFAPDDVPVEWAAAAAGIVSGTDTLHVKQALAKLERVRLATVHRENTLSLHQLVRRRVHDWVAAPKWTAIQRQGAGAVLAWLRATVDETRIAEVDARREHVKEALTAAEKVEDDLLWIGIADGFATHLQHRAEFALALDLAKHALEKAEVLNPPNPAWLASILSNLATIWRDLGNAAQARSLLERALVIDEKTFGPYHRNVALRLSNLATVHHDLGDTAAARALLERSLAIDEKIFGPNHRNVAVRLSNLATVRKDLGDAAAAVPLLERALAIDEATLGPDHPHLAVRLSNLAIVRQDLGDAADAQPLLERALAIQEKMLGPGHPDVAVTLSNLATVRQALGDAAAARPLLERALAIDEKTLPPDHPNVAVRLSNLATVLKDLGEAAAARSLLERALAIQEKTLGPDHFRVAVTLSNLGTVQQDLGDVAAAQTLHERALAIDEKAFGPNHSNIAVRLSNLAVVRNELGDAPGAQRLLQRAQTIAEQTLPANHAWRVSIRNNLAQLQSSLPFSPTPGVGAGPLQSALRLSANRDINPETVASTLRSALEISQRDDDLPNATRAALLLGSHHGKRGGWEEAQRVLRQGLKLAQQSGEPLLLAEAYRLLGDALLHGSLYEEARLCYKDALRGFDALGDAQRALKTRLVLVPHLVAFGHLAEIPPHLEFLRKIPTEGLDDQLRADLADVLALGEKALQLASRGSSTHEER